MSGVIGEAVQSRRLDTEGAELTYPITGTMDHSEVFTLLVGEAPAEFFGHALDRLAIEPVDWNVWRGTASYVLPELKKPAAPETGDFENSFDTTGGTINRKIAISQEGYPRTPFVAPDLKGAIGVAADGSVTGVEVPVPSLKRSVTAYQPAALVTENYIKIVAGLTGKKNGSAFKGYAAGELLFLGARGTQRGVGDWQVTYDFDAKANQTNLQVGDFTISSARGQDYVWPYHLPEEDGDAKLVVSRPICLFVSEIAFDGDFSLLQIGT